jgi:multimeric flavodoxin WrbA
MKFFAVNCSPRKKSNTASLLDSTIKGAASKGAQTELIHLYDYRFKGCISCLACKTIKNRENGLCSVKDELTPLLVKMAQADAVVFGSPIYFGDVTAYARAIIERFAYPFFLYSKTCSSKYKGEMKTAFIYNMNLDEQGMAAKNYAHTFEMNKDYFERIFGHSEYMTVCDTMQVKDYSKIISDGVDPIAKAKSRAEKFPKDLDRAFQFGQALVG